MAAGPAWIAAVAVLIIAIFNLLFYLINANSYPRRLLRRGADVMGRSALLVSNRASSRRASTAGSPVVGGAAPSPRSYWCWELLDPSHLYAPSFALPGAPPSAWGVLLLAAFRLLGIAVFVFAPAYGETVYQTDNGWRGWFKFFTNWTFTGFGLTMSLGTALTVLSLRRARESPDNRRRSRGHGVPSPAGDVDISEHKEADTALVAGGRSARWRFVDKAYLLLLQAICAASVALTVFYWALIYRPSEPLRVDNPMKHGASAGVLLLDFGLSRAPVVSYHISAVLLYGTAYCVFMWSWWGATGEWVYTSLDWSKPASLAAYVALPILLILATAVMLCVASFREWCCSRRLRQCAAAQPNGGRVSNTAQADIMMAQQQQPRKGANGDVRADLV